MVIWKVKVAEKLNDFRVALRKHVRAASISRKSHGGLAKKIDKVRVWRTSFTRRRRPSRWWRAGPGTSTW